LINPVLPPEVSDETAASFSDPQLDWDAMGNDFDGRLAPSYMQASVAEMATVLEDWLGNGEASGGMGSDDELAERSEASSLEHNAEEEQPGMHPTTQRVSVLTKCISTF
jgi:hypothetical protein